MNKQEIYYKFIFPDYENLTIYNDSDINYVPESDNVGQKGEVRALCNACPERVITYDQLTATNPEPMYTNGTNGWSADKKVAIKNYIDKYLTIPKYFNLRNYEDSIPTQKLGMSLMVSHTPEVGGDYSGYTKFNYADKVIYCAVMISSGDFFYRFCLPDEVIEKSCLRNTVVSSKFHDNWYLKHTNNGIQDPNDEKTHVYCYTSTIGDPHNPPKGAEKRVFVQHYFVHGNVVPLGQVYDDNGNLVNIGTDSRVYSNQSVTRGYLQCNTGDLIGLPYSAMGSIPTKYSDITEDLKRDFIDLEVTRRILYYHDGTRLYYNGIPRDIHPTRDIPRIKSGYGFNTLLSYQPPDEYVDAVYTYNGNSVRGTPPLQIPYNLLRYCLNDRPPFTDCETVLVMWVADKDPMSSDITSVADLHGCNFQQYAIPISCRCCYKQPVNGEKFSNERFLVSYLNQWVMGSQRPESTYRYHTRCSEAYNKGVFKEVLYLRDLIAYSNDYIIACQNKGVKYHRKGFDIQGYLFKNYSSDFAKLYVTKTFVKPSSNDGHTDKDATGLSMNAQGQFYYIRVNQKDCTGNDIFYINTEGYPNTQTGQAASRRICICKPDTTEAFVPSEKIFRVTDANNKWDPEASPFVAPSTKVNILGEVKDFDFDDVTYHETYGYNDWHIDDSYFIALFNKPTGLQEKSNVLLTLDSSNGKGEELYARLNDVSNATPWGEDLYISSLGVTQYNPILINSVFYSGSQSMLCSLGILDNYIKLDGIVYGSSTSTKQVIVGFKNMLDFHQEDLYHFRYDTTTKTYYPVTEQYDYEKKEFIEDRPSGFNCTAYVMNYS